MEYIDFVKFAAALVFVLALMGGLAFVLKKIGPGAGGGALLSTGKRRLKILETLPLDARRKAILLQRDDVTHLVILSPTGETVVETNIEDAHEKDS